MGIVPKVREYKSSIKCVVCIVPGVTMTRRINTPKSGKVTICYSCECGYSFRIVQKMGEVDYLTDAEIEASISHNRAMKNGEGRGEILPVRPQGRVWHCWYCGVILNGNRRKWCAGACRKAYAREMKKRTKAD